MNSSEDNVNVYYTPPIKKFSDTGYITHGFGDKCMMTGRVVESGDSGGYAIELVIKDSEGIKLCDLTLDKFAAMCLIDILNKNIMNQEELAYAEQNGLE